MSDAVLCVLSGEIATQVDKSRARMSQWESMLVPAGSELTVKNASEYTGGGAVDRRTPPDADDRPLTRRTTAPVRSR